MKAWTMVITSALIPFVSGALLYQTFPGFKVDLANTTLENKTLLVLLPVLSGFAIYTCVASLAGIKEMKAQNKQ